MYKKVAKVRDSWGIEYIIPSDMVEDFFRLYNPALPEEFKNKFFGMECYDYRDMDFFTIFEDRFEKIHTKSVLVKMCSSGEYFYWDWELFIPDHILSDYENDVLSLQEEIISDEDFQDKYSMYDVDFFDQVYQKEKNEF
jgi:hypothetical protein